MVHEEFVISRHIGSGKTLELEVKMHPCQNGVLIVNYPGIKGDIDGWNDKYGQIGDMLQEKGIGAVVRTSNHLYTSFPYPQTMIDNFLFVLDHALANAEKYCGNPCPEVYLMGFSAGAGTIAAVASNYSPVEKILLMAPAFDAGDEIIASGLQSFRGDVYIAIGEDDEVVGSISGQRFFSFARSARSRQIEYIPNCDHQFRGEVNGRIMAKAPLWAFAGDKSFPSPEGGNKLYD